MVSILDDPKNIIEDIDRERGDFSSLTYPSSQTHGYFALHRQICSWDLTHKSSGVTDYGQG